ncbi:flavin reductase family protein [Streptomyces malaysiensis]|uniref:flavin reductase family protein n=1 Tax=Streptomyces malaysiensis TaxID=92644 RepID=UPI002B2F3B20|nr:iron-sulfur cluster-binding domain-containing protein [Streptomyces malaysiensis]
MIAAVVAGCGALAVGICLVELRASDGSRLPGFAAGDYIDLELGPGLVRSYPLCDIPVAAPDRYRVAVALDPASTAAVPMLDAYVAATEAIPPDRVHLERFRADPAVVTDPGGSNESFEIQLAGTGACFMIGSEENSLDVPLDHDIDVEFSCMAGTCGSCRVKALEGTSEHRDTILTQAERDAGDTILVYCSRAKGSRLVLDL